MGGIFSKPKLPEPEPPAPLADPEDVVRRARNRRAAATQVRSGRRSTILSDRGGAGGARETLG